MSTQILTSDLTITGDGILVVAATSHELAKPSGWRTLVCGVGPVDAAAATAAAITQHAPLALLHVGIAGVRRARSLPAGSLVIGSDAKYCDLAISPQWAPNTVAASAILLAAVQAALPDAVTLTIGTSARVGGSTGCDVEAMEGFAVLRAAEQASIPAVEVRVISNDIEERDRTRWEFALAFETIIRITPSLVAAISRAMHHA